MTTTALAHFLEYRILLGQDADKHHCRMFFNGLLDFTRIDLKCA